MILPPKTISQAGESAEDWGQARRPYLLCRLLRDFFNVFSQFHNLYATYAKGGGVDYDSIKQLVGSESRKGRLWELKDLCHRLWRAKAGEHDLYGCLFDWIVGSSFHEAMKLKENLYLRDCYAPMLGQQRSGPETSSQATGGFRLAEDAFRRFLDEAEGDVVRQMETIAFLLGQANYLLRVMAADLVDNALFMRELCEQSEQIEAIWCESLEQLFADLFPGAPEAGFLLAGRSYLEGHWDASSLAVFEHALALNPQNSEARLHVHQLRARLKN